MNVEINEHGQPVGFALPDWKPLASPSKLTLSGRFVRLEPLNVKTHANDLYDAYCMDKTGELWTYLPYGPFAKVDDYIAWIERSCCFDDPLFFAIVDTHSQKAIGVASYLRIDPKNGSIEVGHLCFSPVLSKTPGATEAMYLMMDYAFTLGYRRYEWKCNALNLPSRVAAQRLGFSYEGIFRQATVIKGRNRDTAWYAAIDSEWPFIRHAFERWLSPSNFDGQGNQKMSLSSLTATILVASD